MTFNLQTLLAGWFGFTSAWAFIFFGVDKWLAKTGRARISEGTLCGVSALGGWPGGLLGMLVFRHKSAKGAFLAKFVLAFFIWAALVFGALKWAKVF